MVSDGATPASATAGSHNAAGQPDTPMEVLTDLLSKALQCDDLAEVKKLTQQAYNIAAGLDPYLDSVCTPPSQVRHHACQPSLLYIRITYLSLSEVMPLMQACQDLIQASVTANWNAIFEEVR
jgi:hypothetical protein